MRINLGCGPTLRAGWLNVDCRRLHPDGPEFLCSEYLTLDGRIEDGSAERIVARGVLERVPWRELEALLVVLAKKLRPGGTLALRVPDGESIAHAFAVGALSHHQAQRLLYGDQGRPEDARRTLWSTTEARRRLETVGLEVMSVKQRGHWLTVRGRRPA